MERVRGAQVAVTTVTLYTLVLIALFAQRKEAERQLAKKSAALARLQEAGTRLWRTRDLRQALDQILAGAIELLGADMGIIRILDPTRGVLKIGAHRGWLPVAVIGNDTARFEPSNITAHANDSIIHILDVALIAEGSCAMLFQSREVFWVHPRAPLCARRLGGSLGQTVYGGVALGTRHSLQIGIIRMAANKSRPSRQCQLRFAFS